jgi:hypothetical protein
LVNREASAVTGCFRTTNLGALMMESGFRPATAQLENRQRRFGLRLLSLPRGNQAGELVGAPSAIGIRLETTIGYSGRLENTALLQDPQAFDATTLVENEVAAKAEAERIRPGLTMFTDGSRVTLRHYERRGQISPSRSVGVLPMRASQAKRRLMSGQSWPQKSRTPEGSSGSGIQTGISWEMPLPRPFAHLKQETSEKKWEEARRWSASGIAVRKYRLPSKQRPDGTVASSGKSIASWFYQLRTGHTLTGQYPQRMKNRLNAKCG